jgi:hypothetical protein
VEKIEEEVAIHILLIALRAQVTVGMERPHWHEARAELEKGNKEMRATLLSKSKEERQEEFARKQLKRRR